jgi:hypothetical protein
MLLGALWLEVLGWEPNTLKHSQKWRTSSQRTPKSTRMQRFWDIVPPQLYRDRLTLKGLRKLATSKRGKRKRPSAVPVVSPFPAAAPVLVPMGRTVKVEIKKGANQTLTYVLTDGSKMTLMPIIAGIERSLNKFASNGDPIYQAQIGFFLKLDKHKKLIRGTRK